MVHVFAVLRAPEVDAVLQVGSHQSRAEGQNHLPRPAGHASFDAAQDTVGLPGCEYTLPAHVQLFIHQYPPRAAPNPFIPQPVLILGVAPTQVHDLAFGLVEPHEVHIGPLLKLVQVPLDGSPSLRHVNCTTQLGVICRLAEGALNHTVYVVDEDIKQIPSPRHLLSEAIHMPNSSLLHPPSAPRCSPSPPEPRPPLLLSPKWALALLHSWQVSPSSVVKIWREEIFPNIQSKPPLAQLEAISSRPITCYLGEETDPHLSTTSFQRCMGLLWPKCRTLHLALLNLIQLTSAHPSSLSRSLCRAFLASSRSTLPHNLVSSANLLRVHSIPSSRSLIKILNRTGPNTEPWGTPLVIGCQLDLTPFTTALCAQPSSHVFTQRSVHLSKP
ncbi:hypothetical protein QYF61_014526 [Mycteria americana]|uniref:Uncharacterized protein n=1 Tax=Mycteria americana TaxID=33587 RepID=A0AAN7S3J4_MYCAM|nr:hypothetical protein QYF61_014526 [Mycteria americana]